MNKVIYTFNGKDITMNICIQIRDVVKLLQEHFHIAFEEAVLLFYKSSDCVEFLGRAEIRPDSLNFLYSK